MNQNLYPWRGDPVVVVRDDSGGFIVVPPYKLVAAGDTLTFKFYDCDSLKVSERNRERKLFGNVVTKKPNLLQVKILDGLKPGLYEYDAVCLIGKEQHRAKGASPPGVIVDP